MNERYVNLLTLGIASLSSIAIITLIFLWLGNANEALKGTFIAMFSSSLTMYVYPRLLAKLTKSSQRTL
jgi:hypothetical protein